MLATTYVSITSHKNRKLTIGSYNIIFILLAMAVLQMHILQMGHTMVTHAQKMTYAWCNVCACVHVHDVSMHEHGYSHIMLILQCERRLQCTYNQWWLCTCCVVQKFDGAKLWQMKPKWNFDKQNFDKLIVGFVGEISKEKSSSRGKLWLIAGYLSNCQTSVSSNFCAIIW